MASHLPTPIFLFSLPRSGSTLCQRILSCHKEIATSGEPHLLLSLLYAQKEKGVYSEYRHQQTAKALQRFGDRLPGGSQNYEMCVQTFARTLYGMASPGRELFFLDKTPRYAFICDDIFRVFPDARFIFLWRNPLSVISSIMETWNRGQWNTYDVSGELFEGMERLLETYQRHRNDVCSLTYEEMVLQPEATFRRVFAYLNLTFSKKWLQNYSGQDSCGPFADPHAKLAGYQQIRADSIDKWRQHTSSFVRKEWCRRYLQWLGADRLALMGYDLDKLLDQLAEAKGSTGFFGGDVLHLLRGYCKSLTGPGPIRSNVRRLLKRPFFLW
jgi:hypothetical protein